MYDILCDIWKRPERAFSPMPVWVWDAKLSTEELVRQLDVLHRKGIDGVIIKSMIPGEMTEEYFKILSEILAAAKKRFMSVCVCDTRGGAELISLDRRYSLRTLYVVPAGEEEEGAEVLYRVYLSFDGNGRLVSTAFGPKDEHREYSFILGYEKEPSCIPDILNYAVAEELLTRIYEKYYSNIGEYFGNTVIGFMSDGVCPAALEEDRIPWSYGFIEDFFEAGGDFHMLAALFFEAKEKKYRREGLRALKAALEKRMGNAYCRPLSKWCSDRKVAHMGSGKGYSLERYFDVPGKKGETLSGEKEASAFYAGLKSVADFAAHSGISRNYSELPSEETAMLPNEMLKELNLRFQRGANLIILPEFSCFLEKEGGSPLTKSSLWGDFRKISDYTKRMSWLNFAGSNEPECAVLCNSEYVPHTPVGPLLDEGYSFNYLSTDDLMEKAEVTNGKIRIDRYTYGIILIDSRLRLSADIVTKIGYFITGGGLMYRGGDFVSFMNKNAKRTTYFRGEPGKDVRLARIRKSGCDLVILANEGDENAEGQLVTDISSGAESFDSLTGEIRPMLCEMDEGGFAYRVTIPAHSVKVIGFNPDALPKLGSGKKLPLMETVSLAKGRMTFDWRPAGENQIILNFGEISEPVDVTVNGEFAGRLIFKPYELDITSLVREGGNTVSAEDIEFSGCTVKIRGSN